MRFRKTWTAIAAAALLGSYGLSVMQMSASNVNAASLQSAYYDLQPDLSTADPMKYLDDDHYVKSGFSSNLPLVVITMDEELKDYKDLKDDVEFSILDEDPYITGSMKVINGQNGVANPAQQPEVETDILIKKRGKSSYGYAKSQYKIKTVKDGLDNPVEMLGMDAGDNWVLNGSMADKSMIRNYIAYRLASEIGGETFSPDSHFCEVLIQDKTGLKYQGVFLLMESVERQPGRVDIQQANYKEKVTSYIVYRDRETDQNILLDTYGRLSGINNEWISLKYPPASRVTEDHIDYIEADFSRIEQILYSEDESQFELYKEYINVPSFIDYFLVNEFFGNYDSGLHSTYMYKNPGEPLSIGPVWDFDQAMNNSARSEANPEHLAMQTRTFFEELCQDKYFVNQMKKRYAELRRGVLSDENVERVIDQSVAYLKSAQVREWNRWADVYLDRKGTALGGHKLDNVVKDGIEIDRFNTIYDQEIYTLKTYLRAHGENIAQELEKLKGITVFNTSAFTENEFILLLVLALFLCPALLIARKG